MNLVLGNNKYFEEWINNRYIFEVNDNYSSYWSKNTDDPIHYIYQGDHLVETYYKDMEDNEYVVNEEVNERDDEIWDTESTNTDTDFSSESEEDDFETV